MKRKKYKRTKASCCILPQKHHTRSRINEETTTAITETGDEVEGIMVEEEVVDDHITEM